MPKEDASQAVLDLIKESATLGLDASRSALASAFVDFGAAFTVSEIAEAIESGSVAPLFDNRAAWEILETALLALAVTGGALYAAMRSAADRSITLLPSAPALDAFDFDAFDAQAIEWLERRGARMVTQVTDNTRQAITRIVQDAFLPGGTTRDAAKRIMRLNGFGLTKPQTLSLEKYAAELDASDVTLTGAQKDRKIKARYRKMLRHRARVVAETEHRDAANAGQSFAWEGAVEQGHLDTQLLVQEWITVQPCPRCQALDGITAEIGGEFVSRPVASGSFAGQIIVISAPTVHPLCECTRQIIARADAQDRQAA